MKRILILTQITLFLIPVLAFAQQKIGKEQKNEVITLIGERLTDLEDAGTQGLKEEKKRAFVENALLTECLPKYNLEGKNENKRLKEVKIQLKGLEDKVAALISSYEEANRLENQNIITITVSLKDEQAVYPGKSSYLVVSLESETGNIYNTSDDLSFSKLDMEFTGLTLSNENSGLIQLDYSADECLKYTEVSYKISYKSNPTVVTSGSFPIQYDSEIVANYSGRNGQTARDGTWGQSVSGDGGNGGLGGSGTAGETGQNIEVNLVLKTHPITTEKLIYAKIMDDSYLISLNKGKLIIKANGGNGGRGGQGGQGGNGSSMPESSQSGNGGNGGQGGNGGDGGDGGSITVTATKDLKEYISKNIVFENRGGYSGNPGSGGTSGSAGPQAYEQPSGSQGSYGHDGTIGRSGLDGSEVKITFL